MCQTLEARVGEPRCCEQWMKTTLYTGIVILEVIKVFLQVSEDPAIKDRIFRDYMYKYNKACAFNRPKEV